MAIEILRRGKATPELNKPQQQPEANFLTRTGLSALRGLEAPGQFLSNITELLGEPALIRDPTLSQDIMSKLGVTEQQIRPQSGAEEIFQGGLEKIPTTLALGGGLPQVGLGFLGSAGRYSAQEAGFGPVGQTVAELGTEVLGSTYGRGLRPGKIRKELRPKMEKAYDIAHKEVETLGRQKADNLSSFITQEIDQLDKSGLDKAARKNLKTEFINVNKDIFDNAISPKEAWNWKKHFNSLISGEYAKSDPDQKLIRVYRRMVGNLNEVLERTGKQNPKFGKPYFMAEDIYKGLDAPNKIRQILEEQTSLNNIISKNPTAKAIAALGTFWKGGAPLTATLAAAPFAARYGARAYDLFSKSKTAQYLAQKISKDIASDNIKSATNAFIKLDKEVKKLEKQYPEKKSSNIEIIRRGKS